MVGILEIILICIVFLVGGFFQGTAGFGFGVLSMGILPIFLNVKESIFIVLALTIFLSINILLKYWSYIRFKQMIYFVIGGFSGRIVAFLFVDEFGDADWMKQILGLFLLVVVIYMYMTRKRTIVSPLITMPIVAFVLGIFGGFVGGAFGVGGPVLVLYLMQRFKDKKEYHANLQALFIMFCLFSLLAHGFNGDLNQTFWLYILVGSVAAWIGVKVGMKWFDRLPREKIQLFAYLIVFASGLNLLFA